MERNKLQWVMMVLLVGGLTVSSLVAEETSAGKTSEMIPHPKNDEFITDIPNIIDPVNEKEINSLLTALQEENGVTIYIVAISSLAKVGRRNSNLESLAAELMKKWNVSRPTLDGKPWDKGVLILFSQNDNKIRIEIGKGWGVDLDKPALAVIHRDMVPYFSREKYSLGLSKGIRSLGAAIRMQTPTRKVPPKVPAPKDDEYVIDTVNLLPMELKFIADKQCRELYKKHDVPMFVVTATSLEDITRKGLRFEDVARRFYRFWTIGDEARQKAFQDRGVLLFVSRDDNLLGLEFGNAWGDDNARERIRRDIIVKQMAPALKANQLPMAVLNGIRGVRLTAEKITFPKEKTPPSTLPSTQPAAAPQ